MEKEGISKETFVKGIVSLLILIASAAVLGIGDYKISDNAGEAKADESDAGAVSPDTSGTEEGAGSAEAYGSFVPGNYTASASGISSNVTVVCTFDESSLTAIGMDVSGETPEIGGAIAADISSEILSSQSADVDAISGATVTSNAVKKAVTECFSLAGSQ